MDENIEADLFACADRVVLDFEVLGVDPDEKDPDLRGLQVRRANLLAGLLWSASEVMIDHLFDDLIDLHAAGSETDARQVVSKSWVLSGLPPRFAHKITPLVGRKLLVTAVDLTSRLTHGWRPPSSVAQELMLRLLLDEAESLNETYGADLEENWRDMLDDLLFDDVDHELLYSAKLDGFEDDPTFPGPPGMASMTFADWFVPFNSSRRLPPYAEDLPPDGQGP